MSLDLLAPSPAEPTASQSRSGASASAAETVSEDGAFEQAYRRAGSGDKAATDAGDASEEAEATPSSQKRGDADARLNAPRASAARLAESVAALVPDPDASAQSLQPEADAPSAPSAPSAEIAAAAATPAQAPAPKAVLRPTAPPTNESDDASGEEAALAGRPTEPKADDKAAPTPAAVEIGAPTGPDTARTDLADREVALAQETGAEPAIGPAQQVAQTDDAPEPVLAPARTQPQPQSQLQSQPQPQPQSQSQPQSQPQPQPQSQPLPQPELQPADASAATSSAARADLAPIDIETAPGDATAKPTASPPPPPGELAVDGVALARTPASDNAAEPPAARGVVADERPSPAAAPPQPPRAASAQPAGDGAAQQVTQAPPPPPRALPDAVVDAPLAEDRAAAGAVENAEAPKPTAETTATTSKPAIAAPDAIGSEPGQARAPLDADPGRLGGGDPALEPGPLDSGPGREAGPTRGPDAGAAAARAAAAQTSGAALTAQLRELIAEAPGEARFELTLNPPELGRVAMEFEFLDEQLTLVIRAERAEALELMRKHSAELLRDIRALGVDIDDVAFDLSDGGGGAGNGDREDRRPAFGGEPNVLTELEAVRGAGPAGPKTWTLGQGVDLRV